MKRIGRWVIAVDIGGTSMKGARVGPDGRILARARVRTPVERGEAGILEALEGLCRRLSGRGVPAGVGLGVPGAVRPAEGVVASSPNVPCWKDHPIGPRLAERLGRPVVVDNDANCAALGEAWRGAGRGAAHLLMVTLGTGVGGGVVLDGRLWHGETGRAGELGHTVVDPSGLRCACGARGCLEAYAGATAIVSIWRNAPPSIGRKPRGAETLDARGIARLAASGHRRAAAVFAAAGCALGIAVASWIQILDVHTVLVGGGVSPSLPLLEPYIRQELRARLFGLDPDRIRIARAALGDDAGILGAARRVLEATAS